MKLDYRILWCDDQPKSIGPFKLGIETVLRERGFRMNVTEFTGMPENSLLDNIDEADVDLILVDWKLGSDEFEGQDVAHKLRSRFRYTDIVFYSSESPAKLRELIFDAKLDGVYCINRNALQEEAEELIERDLMRRLDVEQMRGLVIAEVADLDIRIEHCLLSVQAALDETNRQWLGQYVVEKLAERHHSAIERGKEAIAADDPIASMVDKGLLGESALRLTVLRKALSRLASQTGESWPNRTQKNLSQFRREVAEPRNVLAHQAYQRDGDALVFLGKKDTRYDEAALVRLRKTLLSYQDQFATLKDQLDRSDHAK